ncbi:hypothetical protein KR009_006908 [Drosophila setifemur]|nr:hypothetical protein KR009_006908 [Drosophila setifemur]
MPSHPILPGNKPSQINPRGLFQNRRRPFTAMALDAFKQRNWRGNGYAVSRMGNGAMGDMIREWNSPAPWNGNQCNQPLMLEERPDRSPPSPPQNLDWEASPRRNQSPIGPRHRELSPNLNQMGYRNFEDQPILNTNQMSYGNIQDQPQERRGNNEYGHSAYLDEMSDPRDREPERIVPMDNVQRFNDQQPDADRVGTFPNHPSFVEPLPGNPSKFNDNREDNFGYQSFDGFDGYRRGNQTNFIDNPNPTGFGNMNREFSKENLGPINDNYGQWQPYSSGNDQSMRNKRGPEPMAAGRPGKRVRQEISDRVFLIGGIKLPYLTFCPTMFPQPESKSYAVRFYKKVPNYRIGPRKETIKQPTIEHIYVEIVDDAIDLGTKEMAGKDNSGGFSPNRFREKLSSEFTKIYRGRNYRAWTGWWKDFRNIDVDILKQLDKFQSFNVKYNFMQEPGSLDTGELLKSAFLALTKNRNNYLGNMRIIFNIMDANVLGNLPMEAVGQLQDSIRNVPNHLWVFKMRCMVYLWYHYSQVIIKAKDLEDKAYQMVLKEWNSPVIHWLAKQAFFELRYISKIEYPEYNEMYGKGDKDSQN